MDKLNMDDSDDESIQHREGRRLASVIADKDDQSVPFPRMCGAVFTGNDKLVYFFSSLRLPNLGTMGSKPGKSKSSMKSSYTYVHPRSYDSLEQFKAVSRLPKRITTRRLEEDTPYEDQDQDEDELLTIPSLFFKPKNLQPTRGISTAETPGDVALYPGAKQQSSGNFVSTMDVSGLLPINRELAPHYTLLGDDPVKVCRHNAKAALAHNRDDLFKVWSLAALILTECVGSVENPAKIQGLLDEERAHESMSSLIDGKRILEMSGWGGHPFGRVMVQSLMQHFEKLGDIQTLALLACVFSQPFPPRDNMVLERAQPDLLGSTDYFNIRSYRSNFNNPSWGDSNGNSAIDHILRTPFTVPAKIPRSSSLSSQFSSRPAYPTLDDSPRGYQQYEVQSFMTPRGALSSQSHVPPGIGSGGGSSAASNGPLHPFRKDSTMSAYNQPMYTPFLGNRSRRGSLNYDNLSSSLSVFKRRPAPSIVPIETVKVVMMNEDEFDEDKRPAKVTLLDPALGARYDCYRLAYAETLYRWGLLDARAEVLKFIAIHKPWNSLIRAESRQIGLEFATYCSECNKELPPGSKCFICDRKRAGLKCVICRVTVKGLTNFCLLCLHGGHSNHIRDWFSSNQMCPTGCGCLCILNNGGFGAS
ncbi:hypothetical protein K493DRAFT_318085 [Basidiobolus meristosporus CBS 931.73]|uniref:WDR59/RTC1-like RING zinc finger domain-containing protein n=1 Tax=Basidiobolus meristosporus CBS 931.73 TaxID=1314790 RepID=A0A1Y1XX79_9FUNG|nr:hypothetical protein K493DRAFT_318085 [Basidiobolus meristosporus CBS 931.73]|eukprot:ORX90285.1 hypothetical protein K493DRAFT_318085 [Basidiobolus meristosporus CBS 931.73]